MKNVIAIILAAGKGTRMKSDLPKVFHKLAGRPMLNYVLDTVEKLRVDKIYVVVGHQAERVIENYKNRSLTFVEQEPQLGTGHAVMQVEPHLKDFEGAVLILSGDTPLLTAETVNKLIETHLRFKATATILTAELSEPGYYGRIIRNPEGEVGKIVEAKEATSDELKIREINTGTYCFQAKALCAALKKIKPENVQQEYYLTDVIGILKSQGEKVYAYKTSDPDETIGINTQEELVRAEKILLSRKTPFSPSAN